jgi:hypothetical protein
VNSHLLIATLAAHIVAAPISQPNAVYWPVPSAEGLLLLDFKFGMQRGEVEAILRNPTSRMRSLTAPEFGKRLEGLLEELSISESTLSLAGEKIGADFGFAQSILVSIVVNPVGGISPQGEEQKTKMQRWHQNTMASLEATLGKGREEPAPNGMNLVRTTWIQGKIAIELTRGFLYKLSYYDVDGWDRVVTAAGERTRKKHERVLDPRASTSPSTWAKSWGWMSLRWGMGPADVAKRIAPSRLLPQEDVFESDSPEKFSATADLQEPLYGRYVHASFYFRNNSLYSVYVVPLDEAAAASSGILDWHKKVRAGLTKKRGRGDCSSDDSGDYCGWTGPETSISLSLHSEKGQTPSVLLSYSRRAPRMPNAADQELEKL